MPFGQIQISLRMTSKTILVVVAEEWRRISTGCEMSHILVEHRFRTNSKRCIIHRCLFAGCLIFPHTHTHYSKRLRHKQCSFYWTALQILYRKFEPDDTIKAQTRTIYIRIHQRIKTTSPTNTIR